MSTQRWALCLSYDGSQFHGWQRQPNVASVQAALEQALSTIANHPITVQVAGRTDAGVHALGQLVTFTSSADRQPRDWLRGSNALTPDSMRTLWVEEVDERFHARFSATSRTYTYVYCDASIRPLLHGRVWFTPALNADAMHQAAQHLLGEHDFSSFRGAGCQSSTPIRRVDHCRVQRRGPFVLMNIQANAFLLHMVRNIASALADVGRDQASWTLDQLLQWRDRQRLGATAPPQGLYFVQAQYPQKNFPAAEPLTLVG